MDIIEKIKGYFSDKNIEIIYIFGSFARNELREDSDIDIAIITDYNFEEHIKYINDLENILNYDIDLINFNKIDINFQSEIIIEGRCIFFKDEYEKQKFEMKILSNYLTFEEDRKVVIDEVYKRGSVFSWKE